MDIALQRIQEQIDQYKKETENSVGELSDTYHSFNDLYNHRTVLTALAFLNLPFAWKSRKHEDGTMFDGMFIVGAPTPEGMITYHYDNEYWDLFKVPEIPHAPKFDGHTPDDVLNRLMGYIMQTDTYMINDLTGDKIFQVFKKDIEPVFDNSVDLAAFVGFYATRGTSI